MCVCMSAHGTALLQCVCVCPLMGLHCCNVLRLHLLQCVCVCPFMGLYCCNVCVYVRSWGCIAAMCVCMSAHGAALLQCSEAAFAAMCVCMSVHGLVLLQCVCVCPLMGLHCCNVCVYVRSWGCIAAMF